MAGYMAGRSAGGVQQKLFEETTGVEEILTCFGCRIETLPDFINPSLERQPRLQSNEEITAAFKGGNSTKSRTSFLHDLL